MPLLSVVVPTYNRAGLLRQTLDSLVIPEDGSVEVWVVDDGSRDYTQSLSTSNHCRVKLLHQSNQGPGAARNLGLRHARGEYLAFLDSDDVWFPWSAQIYTDVIRSAGRPAFVAGKPYVFRTRDELPFDPASTRQCLSFPDYLSSGDQWRWFGTSSFVIRRDEVEKVGGFACAPGILNEDADLALKLGIAPGFVQILAPATFGYRVHAHNSSRDLDRNLVGARRMIRVEKGAGYPGGSARARERWRIETRHLRPTSIECLQKGRLAEGWSLYWGTFCWHLALGRWKYLMGFPLLALKMQLRKVKTAI